MMDEKFKQEEFDNELEKLVVRDGCFILYYPNDRKVYYPIDTITTIDETPAE